MPKIPLTSRATRIHSISNLLEKYDDPEYTDIGVKNAAIRIVREIGTSGRLDIDRSSESG
jgi:hypothetical protein